MVCKTTHVGATPTRDSIFSGIGVERHAPLAVRSTFQTGVKGALPSCPSNFRDTNPGAGQDFHRPGCGGSTPPSCRVRVANFDSEVPALNRRELGANPRRPTICASVVKLLSSSASNGEFAGGSPAGCTILRSELRMAGQFTGMWLNPNSRGSRLRIWQPWGCNSLHAHHFPATGFSGNSSPRRLKIAEPSGCKSRVADRRVVNRE